MLYPPFIDDIAITSRILQFFSGQSPHVLPSPRHPGSRPHGSTKGPSAAAKDAAAPWSPWSQHAGEAHGEGLLRQLGEKTMEKRWKDPPFIAG